MTSALRGGRGVSPKEDVVRRLREFSTVDQSQMRTRGKGVQNPKNFADVIYGRPLTSLPNSQLNRSSNLATHPSPLSDADEANSAPAKRERESKLT